MTSTQVDRTGYPGGKGKSFHHVINVMPPHERYIETHLGSGAVMRRKLPAFRNIGIELDERVVQQWSRSPMKGVEVIHGDAVTVLAGLTPDQRDLIYCDPPFLPSTRQVRSYRHEYTEADHEGLLNTLLATPARVVLSGYRSPLYDERLREWHRVDHRVQTRRGAVPESIWTNFRPGPVLHDYSFIGDDFRERERLRRRIRSLVQRLTRATEVERNAALAALGRRRA